MNKVKDFLTTSLGGFGLILWYAISLLVAFLPLFLLDLPLLLILALEFVIQSIPIIGPIVYLVAWILSFFELAYFPTFVSVIYYIALVIYIITNLIPNLLTLIALISDLIRNR